MVVVDALVFSCAPSTHNIDMGEARHGSIDVHYRLPPDWLSGSPCADLDTTVDGKGFHEIAVGDDALVRTRSTKAIPLSVWMHESMPFCASRYARLT